MASQEVIHPKPPPNRNRIAELAREHFGPLDGAVIEDRQFIEIELPASNIRQAARILRESDDLEFSLLYDISGLHWPEDGQLELVYHFTGGWHAEVLVLRVRVPEDRPVVPSISEDWPTANWHEREAMDMFRFQFEGHPYPEPLLLEKEMQGSLLKTYPLREPPDIKQRFEERAGKPFRIWKPASPGVEQ